MAGNLITPTSSKIIPKLKVDTFEFTSSRDTVDYLLNLENGSHLMLRLRYCRIMHEFELRVDYNNFHPNKITGKMKFTDGHLKGSGMVEILPPDTIKPLVLNLKFSRNVQCNWIIEVAYPPPDEDQPIKKSAFTFAMDYEAKAEALQELSDFSIICKEKTFPCHKVVLAARSDSLAGLIKDMKNDKMDMKDFAPEVVASMITFLYTDKLPQELSIEDTEELFKIADKYRVDSLRQTCEFILLKDLDMGNALRRLHFAKKYEAEKLLEKSLKIVKENIAQFVYCKEFGILMADFPYLMEDKNMDRENQRSVISP